MKNWSLPILLLFWLFPTLLFGATPWPGEPWQQAQNLTFLDDDFGKNLSGATWNPETRTLWVCVNAPGKFLAIVEDCAGSYKVDVRNGQRGEWAPGGDLEGITQADYKDQSVYLMAEGEDIIRRFDTSVYGVVKLTHSWNIKPHVPTSGGAGSEGITFVPDSWLTSKGFVDKAGAPYVSRNGMGGLFFVAHQNGGQVYVFDLSTAGTALNFVGAYKTSRTESSGLEFDRSNGRLYVWHNLGTNYLEITDLASVALADGTRQFKTLKEYDSPKAGNLEGVAITPTSARDHKLFLVDDDNQDGAALMGFRSFAPDVAAVDVRVAASADDAEESLSGTVTLTSTDLELIREASNQTVGMRFNGVGIPAGARILRAHVQFGTDETINTTATLLIRGQALVNPPAFVAKAKNISTRAKTAALVPWAPLTWTVLGEVGAKQRTPDLAPIIQEVIGLPGWAAGGSVVLLITGKGKRVAEAWDGDKTKAPLLHIEWEP